MKKIIVIILISLSVNTFGQNSPSRDGIQIAINLDIKKEVEKHIENQKEFEVYPFPIYINTGNIEVFQNDSLVFNSRNKEYKAPFKSFYFWRNDTLTFDGAFGIFGGIGFDIKIFNNQAIISHMLSSDDFPSYAYNETDSLIFRLEVPCSNTKLILSEIPDKTKKQIIYGYVEFKSDDYYASNGSAEGQEVLPRKRMRNNMKLYFKSGYFNL